MRILFLTHTFNSLSQRLFIELKEHGHELSIEFDINDAVSREAVRLFQPDLILAPYLKRAIPEEIWRHHLCLVVHPGIVGDRGSAALDWAIMEAEQNWGVTVLQANQEMDAGDIWASVSFPMRPARKSSLYRNEVTEAAVICVGQALERFQGGGFRPRKLDYTDPTVRGCWHPPMSQRHRAIDWARDDTTTVLRKIQSADGFPGVADELLGQPCYLFNALEEDELTGAPGAVIAQRDGAVCRATTDGALWITHLKAAGSGDERPFKLPATQVLGERVQGVPAVPAGITATGGRTFREIRYEEAGPVGCLYFDFYNGAMGTDQCTRLLEVLRYASGRDTRVVVLFGGEDFWSNGMHLNLIEAAESPAEESWRNINAIDDLARAIITMDRQLTIAALRGNAGAGGVFLALAADRVWARRGVVLNPHYKSMGNLYGSEYWTYLLPRRAGPDAARRLTENRLPVGAGEAQQLGLVDQVLPGDTGVFERKVKELGHDLAMDDGFAGMLAEKRSRYRRHQAEKPLAQYRAEELEHMKLNFYGFDPSYHVARYNFVRKRSHSWTPLHLARHRRTRKPREL